jgi:hypothetical protein
MPAKTSRVRHRDGEDLVSVPTVVAFDPGGMTGWSVMAVHPEALSDPSLSALENVDPWTHGEIKCNGPDGKYDIAAEDLGCDEMMAIVESWPGALIVLEDFRPRTDVRTMEAYTPMRLNAMMQRELHKLGMIYAMQMPSEKSTASDDRLKLWGFYERAGGMGHARDGDRHSLIAIRKAKQTGKKRGMWWPHLYTPAGDLRD